MSRRTTVMFEDKPVEADEMDFQPTTEPWAEYQIEDGTMLRYRSTVQRVFRVVDRFNANGEPVYCVQWPPPQIVSRVPPHLMQAKGATA